MTNYESPVILRTEELAEGVYLASGCYTASAYIHQTPQSGSGEYRIQVNGQHSADHTKEAQTLTISFSLPVTYTSSGGSLVSGSGTNTLVIKNNRSKMKEADCPDQLCVNQKAISKNNESIICLPNKVVVEVESSENSEFDAVSN